MAANNIACIVLNYKSNSDLFRLIPQLVSQSINPGIVVIDNNSGSEFVNEIHEWMRINFSDYISGSFDEVSDQIASSSFNNKKIIFFENNTNTGYSAGNNIGIRLARLMGCEAALIVNPDVIVDDNDYLLELSRSLFSHDQYLVAASRVVDLKGSEQNPQRESTYLEELIWPYLKIRNYLFKKTLVQKSLPKNSCAVEKVSGCCMLLRLNQGELDFFDENVFLYCEEAILSMKLKSINREIVFNPGLFVIHNHKSESKPLSNAQSGIYFTESRVYFLKNYSSYKGFKLRLILLSYATMKLYFKLKMFISSISQKY